MCVCVCVCVVCVYASVQVSGVQRLVFGTKHEVGVVRTQEKFTPAREVCVCVSACVYVCACTRCGLTAMAMGFQA